MICDCGNAGNSVCLVREQLRARMTLRAATLFRLRWEISRDSGPNGGQLPQDRVAHLHGARTAYWNAVEVFESHVKEHHCVGCPGEV
ncbi:hypothetical protein Acid345_3842 [Candidatus Koribacter versatilis Ellin345]|uniref:Uncharacterized protein n=1 Tax=Koribacter versatilis (strain Ellin345) TaxID=204669 RepID=Q1IJV8_KORVE|nr:hypothetical protein Acid345_3842 [Candidatus Koribacter versatilis Ellin345]